MGKRFNAVTPKPKGDGGTWWHKVGTAYENSRGMTLYLDSIPTPSAEHNGRVVVMLFEAEENDQQRSRPQSAEPGPRGGGAGSGSRDMDDEVPF